MTKILRVNVKFMRGDQPGRGTAHRSETGNTADPMIRAGRTGESVGDVPAQTVMKRLLHHIHKAYCMMIRNLM